MEATGLIQTLLLIMAATQGLSKIRLWQDDVMPPAGPSKYGNNETGIRMESVKKNHTRFAGNVNSSLQTISRRSSLGFEFDEKLNNQAHHVNKRGSRYSPVLRQWFQPPGMFNPWPRPQGMYRPWFPPQAWPWGQSEFIFRPWPEQPEDDDYEPSETDLYRSPQKYLYGHCKQLEDEPIEPTSRIDVFIEDYEEIGCKCSGKSCTCCYFFMQKLICRGTTLKGNGLINRMFVGGRVVLDQKIKSLDLDDVKSGRYNRHECQALPNCLHSSLQVCVSVKFGTKSNTDEDKTTVTIDMKLEFLLFWQFQLCVIEMPSSEIEVQNDKDESRDTEVVVIVITFEDGKKEDNPVKVMLVKKSTEEVTAVIVKIFEEQKKQRKEGKEKGIKKKSPKRGKPAKRKNWEPAKKTEVSFLAILYIAAIPALVRPDDDFAESSPEAKKMAEAAKNSEEEDPEALSELNFKVDVKEGETCGGVLLSANEVLTLCSCVRFFYLAMKYNDKEPPEAESKELKETPSILYSKNIYITFSSNSFRADQTHYKLDHTIKSPANAECFDLIEEQHKTKKPLKSYNLETRTAVMGISPSVDHYVTRPHLFNLSYVKETSLLRSITSVNLMAVGLQKKDQKECFFDDSGKEIEPHFEPVKSSFEKCPLKNCQDLLVPTNQEESDKKEEKEGDDEEEDVIEAEETLRELGDNVDCLCSKMDFELCNGAPGFPLVTEDGGIVGLSSTPMDCERKGAVAVRYLDDDTVMWHTVGTQSNKKGKSEKNGESERGGSIRVTREPKSTSCPLRSSSLLIAMITSFALAIRMP